MLANNGYTGRELRMSIMKKLVTALLLSAVACSAQATLINVDFQPAGSGVYGGPGILGGSSDTFWNSVNYNGSSGLTLADGTTATGVGVQTSFDASFSNLGWPYLSATNPLLADRLYGSNASQSQTITITGLSASTAYNVALYNGFYAQTYSANRGSVTGTTDPVAGNSANSDYPNWSEGVEYAVLDNVFSNSYGNLVIHVTPWDGTTDYDPMNSAIAGLQIESVSTSFPMIVPVPAAAWLFISGLFGLSGFVSLRRSAG
jgi:hypothetical protein